MDIKSKSKGTADNLVEKYRQSCHPNVIKVSEMREPVFFGNRIALTIGETSVVLGVSAKSIERAIKRGEIFAKRIGRRLLIPKSAIEAWLNRK